MLINMDLLILLFCICICVVKTNAATVDRSGCPSSLPRTPNLFASTDSCILLIHEERNWNDARKYCQQHGGDLVVIKDSAKQQFIVNALKQTGWDKKGIWIGANDQDKEGQWEWITGDKIGWSNWARGQGKRHTGFFFSSGSWEDCAQIRLTDSYKWHDFPCSGLIYHYTSICEYSMTKPVTTTELPSTRKTTKTTAFPSTTSKQRARTSAPTSTMFSTESKTTHVPFTSLPTTKIVTSTVRPTTKISTTQRQTTLTQTPAPTTTRTTKRKLATTKTPTTIPFAKITITSVKTTRAPATTVSTSTAMPTVTPVRKITVQPPTTSKPFPLVKSTKAPVRFTTPGAKLPTTLRKQKTPSTPSYINPTTPAPKMTSLVVNKKNPSAKTSSQTGKKTKSKPYTGYIIGGCVVAVVAGALLVGVILFRRRRNLAARNEKYYGQTNPTYDMMHGNGGADVEINDVYSSHFNHNYGESKS